VSRTITPCDEASRCSIACCIDPAMCPTWWQQRLQRHRRHLYEENCAAGPIGPHNISADPLFVDAVGGDYVLQRSSRSSC